MLEFLAIAPIAQVIAAPPATHSPAISREVLQPQEIRPLPGRLDSVPVFNSNSPELVQTPGILLSTFPGAHMRAPEAHLNYPLEGRFDIFAHHIARGVNAGDVRTLFLGVMLYNPTNRPITLDILQGASYLSQEAPFRNLPSYVANPLGTVFAGPGSRTMNDILRGQRQPLWPDQAVIPPNNYLLLANLPIPLRRLSAFQNGEPLPQHLVPFPLPGTLVATREGIEGDGESQGGTQTPTSPPFDPNGRPPSNGRTLMMYLHTDGPVYAASMAMYAPLNPDGSERAPTIWEWQSLLQQSNLAGPRDMPPTPPEFDYFTRFFYGRVAGVAQGSQWSARLTDSPDADYLSIPPTGEALSYGLSMLDRGTFGTDQIQSAEMLVRYPDTAYRAHGNYGVHYQISIPLQNNTDSTQSVGILLQTPLKDAEYQGGLRFLEPPDDQIFFRGTVRIRYNDDFGIPETRYLHIVQRRGQEGEPLLRLTMPPGDRRLVEVDFLYPPDATPPQMLTIQTADPWIR
jgi:hypothetical protein